MDGGPCPLKLRHDTTISRRPSGFRGSTLRIIVAFLALGTIPQVTGAFSPQARWGQASTVVSNTLYVHGGKVDPSNSYSYTSAPNTNDLFSLDLTTSFSLSNPPWQYRSGSADPSTSQGPSIAFHTLSIASTGQLLSFGGSGGPSMPIQTGQDSAWLLDISNPTQPSWTSEVAGWASQPMRSIYHAAASADGVVWISGGMKADGSLIAFNDTYTFRSAGPSFEPLSTAGGPPDIYGHALITLPSGCILSIGGFSRTLNSLLPMTQMFLLDPSTSPPTWTNIAASGQAPSPRRGFVAAALDDGKILIHGGGDSVLQSIYSDGAILDTTQNPMVWTSAPNLSGGLGARYDHIGIGIGSSQVMFAFGYTTSGPATANLALYDIRSGTFQTTFTPSPNSTTTHTPSTSTKPSQPPTSVPSGSSPNPSLPPLHTPANEQKSPDITKITLASVFGVIGLVALISGGVYYSVRRHERQGWYRGEGSGGLIAGSTDRRGDGGEFGFPPEKAPMAGASAGWQGKTGWSLLGLGGVSAAAKRRFSMLEDEDRDFDMVYPRRAASASVGSTVQRRERTPSGAVVTWGEFYNSSVTSLVSAGSAVSRHVSSRVNPQWWNGADPFADEAALLDVDLEPAVGDLSQQPYDGGHGPVALTEHAPYRDPFADPGDYTPPSRTTMLPLVDLGGSVHPLSLQKPPSLYNSEPATSVSSHDPPHSATSNTNTFSSSQTSHEIHQLKPATSAIPNASITRSDSWWARLSKTAFNSDSVTPRIRKLSFRHSAPVPEPIEFRDPNPPPRLSILLETSTPSNLSTDHSAPGGQPSTLRHGRSLSSVQTAHSVATADTAQLEQMAAEMNVISHARTRSTIYDTSSSNKPTPKPFLRLANRTRSSGESVDTSHEFGTVENSEEAPIVTSPIEITTGPSTGVIAPPLPTVSRLRGTGNVAARIASYERRMTESQEQAMSPVSPRKKATTQPPPKSKANWGLAQRPELYIANPDKRASSGASIGDSL